MVELEPTTDILAAVARQKAGSGRPIVVIGFAAESRDLLDNARAKLESKQLDLIAANDITAPDAGFEAETNRVILIGAPGSQEPLPLLNKQAVAEIILRRAINLLADK